MVEPLRSLPNTRSIIEPEPPLPGLPRWLLQPLTPAQTFDPFAVQVQAANTEPSIIVAASTNNQTVTNIIDAFGKDCANDDGTLVA